MARKKKSSNVEDRRGAEIGGIGAFGGGLSIVAIVIYLLMRGDAGAIFNQIQPTSPDQGTSYSQTAENRDLAEFVSVVLADTDLSGMTFSPGWIEIIRNRSLFFFPARCSLPVVRRIPLQEMLLIQQTTLYDPDQSMLWLPALERQFRNGGD